MQDTTTDSTGILETCVDEINDAIAKAKTALKGDSPDAGYLLQTILDIRLMPFKDENDPPRAMIIDGMRSDLSDACAAIMYSVANEDAELESPDGDNGSDFIDISFIIGDYEEDTQSSIETQGN